MKPIPESEHQIKVFTRPVVASIKHILKLSRDHNHVLIAMTGNTFSERCAGLKLCHVLLVTCWSFENRSGLTISYPGHYQNDSQI